MSANQSTVIPLRGAILGSLSITWALGVIAGSVGLNALIKSNQTKSSFKNSVPAGTTVNINVHDVFTSGIVLTTVGALIAVLCSIFIAMQFFTRRLTVRSLHIQSFILAFCSVWLFACLVPFTDFFANRKAKVTAFIGGHQLPDALVEMTEAALGTTSVYKHISYLRLVAIIPWITLLFTIISSSVLFVAGSRASRLSLAAPVENTQDAANEKHEQDEKELAVASA